MRPGQVLIRGVALLGCVAACNVYTPVLLDDDDDDRDPFPNGGANSGGTGSSSGGFAGVVGPAGGAPSTGGYAGTSNGGTLGPGSGGTFSPGSGGTAGGAGGSGGDAMAGSGGTDPGAGGASAGTGGTSAGTGGTSAGNGGTGGSSVVIDPCMDPVPGEEEPIDNFEDDDEWLTAAGSRNGTWYVFNDGTVGTQSPMPGVPPLPIALPGTDVGTAPASTQGLNVTATGFTQWGTGVGADFVNPKDHYDASAYQGITFWAKVGAGGYTSVQFLVPDTTTEPVGGKCNPAANAPNAEKCSNHFGIPLTLTTSWRKCRVDFDDLAQVAGWGLTAAAVNSAELYGVQFKTKQAVTANLWLDDLAFVLK